MRKSFKKGLCKIVFAPKTKREKIFYVDAGTAKKIAYLTRKYQTKIKTAESPLRHKRLARSLTQAELAETSGIDQGTISALETGRATMRETYARTLASVLKCRWKMLCKQTQD